MKTKSTRVIWQVENPDGVEVLNSIDEDAAIEFAREQAPDRPHYGNGYVVMRGLLIAGRVV